MSFFGAFFAGFTLLSKGISKGQYAIEDGKLKRRSQMLGQDTYYDHRGVMHDMKTGKVTTYSEINKRNILASELKAITENRSNAIANGKEWYEMKHMEAFDYSSYSKWKHKYYWHRRASMYEEGKETWNSRECYFSLNNLHYSEHCLNPNAMVYGNVNHVGFYIKEKYDDYYVYTDLNTGLVIDTDSQIKDALKKNKITWEDFKNTINSKKKDGDKISIVC